MEFRQVWSPDKQGFLKKLLLKFKEPKSTTLLILDKFDENGEMVAKLAVVYGFKTAYEIKYDTVGSHSQ